MSKVTISQELVVLDKSSWRSGIFILDQRENPNVAVAMALTPSKQDGFIAIGEKINE
jgi:hypothetical protein